MEILNDTERKVFIEFLNRLSENMGNAGCNDYQLPDTPEGWQLACEHANSINKDNPSGPQEKPQLICYDWILLSILRKKLGF